LVFRACDIAVLASEIEALPTVLLEAAAAGTPVVSTDVGGVPEIVEDDRSGLLVPVNDAARLAAAIGALIDDGDARARLVAAAVEDLVTRFSPSVHADKTRAVYDAVLADQR
jgi:glycosyltransferase involved in cell wall biosynthesis